MRVSPGAWQPWRAVCSKERGAHSLARVPLVLLTLRYAIENRPLLAYPGR